MIEPFADMNRPIWARLNVMRRNCFRGRVGDLTAHGLTPLAASQGFPQEVFLKVCAVLAEKRAKGRPYAARRLRPPGSQSATVRRKAIRLNGLAT